MVIMVKVCIIYSLSWHIYIKITYTITVITFTNQCVIKNNGTASKSTCTSSSLITEIVYDGNSCDGSTLEQNVIGGCDSETDIHNKVLYCDGVCQHTVYTAFGAFLIAIYALS